MWRIIEITDKAHFIEVAESLTQNWYFIENSLGKFIVIYEGQEVGQNRNNQ
jgi:hypothetical protein